LAQGNAEVYLTTADFFRATPRQLLRPRVCRLECRHRESHQSDLGQLQAFRRSAVTSPEDWG
jgi:hypothetical protein